MLANLLSATGCSYAIFSVELNPWALVETVEADTDAHMRSLPSISLDNYEVTEDEKMCHSTGNCP